MNEVIAGKEDALLDKSVKFAEARAAKLCKMKGGPGDFAKNLANGAASAFAKAWAKEFVRKGVNGKGGTDRLAKPYVDRFTKSTGLDKARELFPPTARDYISKVTKSIRRKRNDLTGFRSCSINGLILDTTKLQLSCCLSQFNTLS